MKTKANLVRLSYIMTSLLMVLAVFALVSLNDSADAQASFSIAGKVTAVDTAKQTMTVQAPSGQSVSFKMADRYSVMRGSSILNFKDIKVGDNAKVWYYQLGTGELKAFDITLF